jgi:hypothetical protein
VCDQVNVEVECDLLDVHKVRQDEPGWGVAIVVLGGDSEGELTDLGMGPAMEQSAVLVEMCRSVLVEDFRGLFVDLMAGAEDGLSLSVRVTSNGVSFTYNINVTTAELAVGTSDNAVAGLFGLDCAGEQATAGGALVGERGIRTVDSLERWRDEKQSVDALAQLEWELFRESTHRRRRLIERHLCQDVGDNAAVGHDDDELRCCLDGMLSMQCD